LGWLSSLSPFWLGSLSLDQVLFTTNKQKNKYLITKEQILKLKKKRYWNQSRSGPADKRRNS
jgi:hypothetical protein